MLDILIQSETLRNVIYSVTKNGKSILLTGMLTVVIVYLFAIVGYLIFRDDFVGEVTTLPARITEKQKGTKLYAHRQQLNFSFDLIRPKKSNVQSSEC